jgi:hypothetical protein
VGKRPRDQDILIARQPLLDIIQAHATVAAGLDGAVARVDDHVRAVVTGTGITPP